MCSRAATTEAVAAVAADAGLYSPQSIRQCINLRRTVADLYALLDIIDPAAAAALGSPPQPRPVGPATFDDDSRLCAARLLALAGGDVPPADDRSAVAELALRSGVGEAADVGWWAPPLADLALHYAAARRRRGERQPKTVKSVELDTALLRGAEAHDPIARWLSSFVQRDERHRRSNCVQEAALVAHAKYVVRQMGRRPTCVADFGGGNGILAYALASVLRCEAVVIDRCVPARRVDDAEARGCPFFRRVVKPIEMVSWHRDVGHRPEHTLVVAKHLCGAGIDAVLRLCGQQGVFFGGLMATTCCHHKGSAEEYVHRDHLRRLGMGGHEAFYAAARKTAWLQAERQEWQQRIGAALEAALDHGRVRWLREYGYAAEAVPYVHPVVTPRNTCLIAWPAKRLTR